MQQTGDGEPENAEKYAPRSDLTGSSQIGKELWRLNYDARKGDEPLIIETGAGSTVRVGFPPCGAKAYVAVETITDSQKCDMEVLAELCLSYEAKVQP